MLVSFWGKGVCHAENIENDDMFSSELIPCYREKWSSLSEFVKDIKQVAVGGGSL